MGAYGWLALYSAAILLFSVLGGYLPFLGKVSHSRLQFYLSISAGVMLGAAIFHVLPDAIELAKETFGWWMALAVVGLFCIERFIAPHSHEVDGHSHGHDHHHHDHGHHHHDPVAAAKKEPRAAAPAVAGWMAVLGLTIHTFMNGFGLAGQVLHDLEPGRAASPAGTLSFLAALPGLAIFLAIFLHKPADALAISTVLSRKGVGRSTIGLVQIGFALMIPAGAVAFGLAHLALAKDGKDPSLENQLTGAALAFSAGTFFFIALSDLLPEVQFHRHDRVPLFLALTLSVVFMGCIALLEPHEEKEAEPGRDANGNVEGHQHPDTDHDAGHDTHAH
jgi:zinc and cadmium transporter